MNDLINKRVFHDRFKEGVIVDADEKRVVVDFEGVTRIFPLPKAFEENILELLETEYVSNERSIRENKPTVLDQGTYRLRYQQAFEDWFNDYMLRTKPLKSYKTYVSDAFYIEDHCPEKDFLYWFTSEETLTEARDALMLVPDIANKPDPKKRATGYLTSMRYFRKFLMDKGILG
jgi:hypothetical protein